MLKRAYLSVTRRKTKSIVMLLFLFVISTLALCSISIKNATRYRNMSYGKPTMGAPHDTNESNIFYCYKFCFYYFLLLLILL